MLYCHLFYSLIYDYTSTNVPLTKHLRSAHLKGRKPPMAMCTIVCLYQGWAGICLGMLRVRHGAWKLPARFFPTMPPMIVSGKPTSNQAPSSRSTVVAGRAWVEPLHQWTEFTTLHVKNSGAAGMNNQVNKRAASNNPCNVFIWGLLESIMS